MKVFIPDSKTVSFNKINNDIKDYLSKNYHIIGDYENSSKFEYNEIYIQHFLAIRGVLKPMRKTILIQPIDGTIIKPKNVMIINKWDVVVTPSNVGKKIMLDNGVNTEIKVIPNYWEDDLLIDNGYFSTKFSEKKWTYYTESSGWDRKNIKNILKFFVEEFKNEPNVRLVIKLSEKKRDLFIPDDIKCEVVIIDEFISKQDLYSIMNNCDCYICLSYMEGFCIPLLNAAVLKKDIICLDSKISGYTDFLNHDNSIMINCKEINIFDGVSLSIFEKESTWEEADYDEYKSALRLSLEKKYKFNKVDNFESYHIDVVMKSYLELID